MWLHQAGVAWHVFPCFFTLSVSEPFEWFSGVTSAFLIQPVVQHKRTFSNNNVKKKAERNKSLHISLLLHLSLSSPWDSSISYIEKPALIKAPNELQTPQKRDALQLVFASFTSQAGGVYCISSLQERIRADFKIHSCTRDLLSISRPCTPTRSCTNTLLWENTHIQHDFICSISAISFHFLPLVILWIFQLFVFFHCVIVCYLILLFVFSALYLFIHKIFPGKTFPRRADSSWAH